MQPARKRKRINNIIKTSLKIKIRYSIPKIDVRKAGKITVAVFLSLKETDYVKQLLNFRLRKIVSYLGTELNWYTLAFEHFNSIF